MLAVLAPGQGSQKPGFLTSWLDLSGVEARLRWWSALAGVDLVHLGTQADADEIKDTAKTQPLLVAAALLAAERLNPGPSGPLGIIAGHSVGEVAAAAIAGVLTPEAAITFAAVRGREMAAACAIEPTGMSAVLGGDADEVVAAIEAAGLYPANRNGAGQIVAAGALSALKDFTAPKAKIIALQVAGAFHTPYMAPAEKALAAVAGGITASDPFRMLLSNADGAAVASGSAMLDRLVAQVTATVRWDLVMGTLRDLGVTGIIELPPAGTLAGLAKRELKGVEIVTLNTPDDLKAANDLIARHAVAPSHEPTMAFVLAVATVAGTFQPLADLAEGSAVKAGQVLGHIVTRQGNAEVTAHDSGQLIEWLAHHDDPVNPGQPLARLEGVLS